jgi:hypothetical protein
MTPTARTRPPVATPSRRPSGVVRATLYDPNVKHGTDACAERTSIGTTVRAIGFGVANFNGRNAEVARIGERVAVGDGPHASDALICAATHAGTTRRIKPEIDTGPSTLPIARSNPTNRWGFKRLLRATYFNAAAQTIGVNRAPSLEMVIGVAAPPNAVSNVQRILHGRGWQPIHAGRCGCDTYTWRARTDRQSAYWTQKHLPARVVGMTAPIHPALRALGFRPTDAGIF